MSYCIHCGKKIEKEDIFCQKCGLRIDGYSNKDSSNQSSQTLISNSKQSQSQNHRYFLLLILIIFTVIVGSAFLFTIPHTSLPNFALSLLELLL